MVGAARYSEKFKQDAIKLVASTSRSVNPVAKDLGVNTGPLRKWMRAAEYSLVSRGCELMTPAESDELKRLRKQVRELELEKEILKKAAQYLAKEMGR